MKEKKTLPHNNTKKTQKPSPFYDQYRDLFTLKMKPIPEIFIEKIAVELIDWAKNNKDALVLRDFFHEKGIPVSSYKQWAQRNEVLRQAVEEAKYLIGSRREKGAIKRQYDVNMIRSSLFIYDPEWKEVEEYQAELRHKIEESNKEIQWVINQFPETTIVPKKKKEDEE